MLYFIIIGAIVLSLIMLLIYHWAMTLVLLQITAIVVLGIYLVEHYPNMVQPLVDFYENQSSLAQIGWLTGGFLLLYFVLRRVNRPLFRFRENMINTARAQEKLDKAIEAKELEHLAEKIVNSRALEQTKD